MLKFDLEVDMSDKFCLLSVCQASVGATLFLLYLKLHYSAEVYLFSNSNYVANGDETRRKRDDSFRRKFNTLKLEWKS